MAAASTITAMPFTELTTSPKDVDKILVKTTLPIIPPNIARPPIITERLILRPWEASDLKQIRILRTQPEVMQHTRASRIDLDEAETQEWLSKFLPPNDRKTYGCAIVLKSTGDIIGTGGVHSLGGEFGWPEVGYMFRHEYWGQGYATEFLRAYIAEGWGRLPRGEAEIMVDPRTANADGKTAEEMTVALTAGYNTGSQRVLIKSGWEHFMTWPAEGVAITLPSFRCFPNKVVGMTGA